MKEECKNCGKIAADGGLQQYIVELSKDKNDFSKRAAGALSQSAFELYYKGIMGEPY